MLDGEIALLAGGFVKESVKAGSQRALEPLFIDDEVDRAVTELGAEVIQFSKSLFEALHQQERHPKTL